MAWAGYTVVHANTPVRVGVLLPLTGDIELREPLEWAKENINREGGIGGRQIELVYRDTATGNATRMAEELLDDPAIRIVIGPETSDQVYALAPAFIARQKILISPLATSGDIVRAFAKKGYFWRTAPGDVAQVKTILSILNGRGAHRIALLAENTTYGTTFYDWTGFFATEYGLDLVDIRQFEPGNAAGAAAGAAAADPDTIIAACGPEDAAAIKGAIDRSGSHARLFLADAAATPVLVSTLGPAAEGIEGTNPAADPSTGFAVAYEQKFGHPPAYYAAPAYDALLLAAYTAARQDAAPLEAPADSVRAVVYGNGTPQGWDAQEAREAIAAIRAGRTPAITGASGPLDFDTEAGVDPLVTYYSHWVIEGGEFRTVKIVSPAKGSRAGTSLGLSKASDSLISPLAPAAGTSAPAVQREDFRAVIAGPSGGWTNYRHQSDALAVYTLLRENGVDDDHIILMTYDDIPTLPQNPIRGDVHNVPKGANLRAAAQPDYTGTAVNAATFRAVLSGERSADVPVVLESGPATDVFVYVAGHGVPGAICFGNSCTFTADDFTRITDTLSREGRYRRMVFVIDTCFGESVAADATAPGILYITGAAATEPSKGAVYDMEIRQWLSDEFTASVLSLLRSDPAITFRDLYTQSYAKVTGSHVRMKATGNFSTEEPVREYLKP